MDDAQNKSSDQTAGGQYDPAVTLTDAGVMDILERVSDALYIIDEQWCLTYLNRKAEQLWGRRRDNLLEKNIWEVFRQVVDPRSSSRLTGMQERAALLGGSLTIEATSGSGTRLTATLPCMRQAIQPRE